MLPLLLLIGLGAIVVAASGSKTAPKPAPVPPAQGLPPLYPMPNPEVPLPTVPGADQASFLLNFGQGHMFALTSPLAPGLQLLLAVTAQANPDDMALIAQAAAQVPGTTAADLGLTAAWYVTQKANGHAVYFQVDPSSQFAHVVLDVPLPGYIAA